MGRLRFVIFPLFHVFSAFVRAGEVYQAKHQYQSRPEQLAEYFDAGLMERLIFFFRRRGIRNTAEDLAHEVYLRVLKKLDQGTDIEHLEAFAYAVARNVAAEELRNQSRLEAFSYLSHEETVKVNRMQDERSNPAPALEQKEEKEELRRLMEACIQELPPEDIKLLVRYVSFSSTDMREELAAELGLSVNALRVKVHRIRERLQQSLRRKLKRAKLGV